MELLEKFKRIKRAKRIGDNRVLIDFYEEKWVFDVTKSNSLIFPEILKTNYANYSSPFDVNLEKACNGADIKSIGLLNNDKLLCFVVEKKGKYKAQETKVIFEITGKHTNIVLVDSREKIISALHIIGGNLSSREIKIGQNYTLPPKPNFTFKDDYKNDIKEFLLKEAIKKEGDKLKNFKDVKLNTLGKKIEKLQRELNNLKDPAEFMSSSRQFAKDGETIFININSIKGYEKEITLLDGEGKERVIKLIPEKTPSQVANFYYSKSKREKSKAINLHLEKDALEERLHFFKILKKRVEGAESKDLIEKLLPLKAKGKEKNQNSNVVISSVEGLKVFVGTNERGNIAVLKEAKADDIWFHIKDIPSSHLILRVDKRKVSEDAILEAAKLCVMYSTDKKDKFLVDYTQRRFVRTQEKANVLYATYKTLTVDLLEN